MAEQERILSGTRPSGPLHIGHLVAALQNWLALQERYRCFFAIADWHASLARFKAPRQVIVGPLPKTSTGKIQKYILREEAKKRFGHFSGFTD